MIKDTLFKSLLIPLLGILIPLFSGLINVQNFTANQIIYSNILFILTSYIIWQGSVKIISSIRVHQSIRNKIFLKLLVMCFLAAVYGSLVITFSCVLWQSIYLPGFNITSIKRTIFICAGVVIFLTVVYETLFLSKERELDFRVLNELDRERLNAELNALKKDLDPHFLFNSLTTLSHLVKNDQDKAYLFIQKLASVYKYFLINRDKDIIPLEEELDFIDNYYFLLKIRFDDHVKVIVSINHYDEQLSILPFTLQTLIENAIKHNAFSETDPLVVNITIEKASLSVYNSIKPKPYAADSTKVGLKNLKARYKLISNKDVLIQTQKNKFIVKLPLVTQN